MTEKQNIYAAPSADLEGGLTSVEGQYGIAKANVVIVVFAGLAALVIGALGILEMTTASYVIPGSRQQLVYSYIVHYLLVAVRSLGPGVAFVYLLTNDLKKVCWVYATATLAVVVGVYQYTQMFSEPLPVRLVDFWPLIFYLPMTFYFFRVYYRQIRVAGPVRKK